MQYLYLISCKSGYQTFYKIGISNDVEARLAQLQTGSPLELSIEGCYGFENAEIVERTLHQAWKKERVRGEWFELSGDGVEKFQEICGLLNGEVFVPENYETSEDAIEEAEEMAELPDGGKWDFAAMFADGWRMEVSNENGNPRNWIWRRGNGEKRKSIYGGALSSLPYSVEEIRVMYRDKK